MQAVVRYIDDLKNEGGLRGTDIANIASVSPATVSRWIAGTHYPHPKTQLLLSDLHYIVGRLKDYYSSDEIRVWLYALHPQLEGRRAIDLINDGQTENVLAILDRLDSESYL
jgi:transcriptional regulator with XRE-family HTH domain